MSVGHLARLLEGGGIATVVIGIRAFLPTLRAMSLPRVVVTPNLLGRTLGPPGDRMAQRSALLAALELLESARAGGEVRTIEDRPFVPVRSLTQRETTSLE
ncbi:MAG: hypothetical protein IIC78_07500 [Chloroflexi bacterium]|nr:hypothetical protein [Chloroflexota bacterium]